MAQPPCTSAGKAGSSPRVADARCPFAVIVATVIYLFEFEVSLGDGTMGLRHTRDDLMRGHIVEWSPRRLANTRPSRSYTFYFILFFMKTHSPSSFQMCRTVEP